MTLPIAVRPKLQAIIAVAAGLAAAVGVVMLAMRGDEIAHAAWRDAILAAPAEELLSLLQEIDAQPDLAIPLLVELLGSRRPVVVAAVGRALHEELEDWRSRPAEQADQNIAMLSAELATSIEELPPPGRQVAAGLAKEMLLWPLDDQNVQTPNILANCEAILRSSKAVGETAIAMEYDIAGTPPMPANLKTPEFAGGGLQVTPAQLPPLPVVTPNTFAQQPQPKTLAEPPAEFHSPLAIPLRLVEKSPPPIERHTHEDVGVPEIPSQSLADLSELELARLLHAADAEVAASAEQELRTRGLGDRELALARALGHPDPREREALARALPQIAGIDPQFWLHQLAQDEDPQVRRTAISIIASGDDEATTRWLIGRRAEELDPQVARRIDELLESRR